MAADGYDPVPGFRAWLERIEAKQDSLAEQVKVVDKKVTETNGRVRDLEEDLHGHSEERRRSAQPGLLARFAPVEKWFQDMQALRRAMWGLITLLSTAFMTQLGILLWQFIGGGK